MKRKLLIAAVALSFIAIVFGIVFIAVEFALAIREDHHFNWYSILFLISSCLIFYGVCKLNLEYLEGSEDEDEIYIFMRIAGTKYYVQRFNKRPDGYITLITITTNKSKAFDFKTEEQAISDHSKMGIGKFIEIN